jgi:hypothetical protein
VRLRAEAGISTQTPADPQVSPPLGFERKERPIRKAGTHRSNFLFLNHSASMLLRSDLLNNGRSAHKKFQHHRPH